MALLEPAAGKASGTGIPDGAALTGAKIDLLKFTVLIILTQQRLLGTLGGRRGGGMSTFHLHYINLPRSYKKLHCKGKSY